MNFWELAENIGLEKEEFLDLLRLFVETSSSDLRKLQSAIDKGDRQSVVEMAHSIKGAAVNLGLDGIYEVARDVEMNARQNILGGAAEAIKSLQEKLDMISKDIRNLFDE
jgi:HPt (histidine-containing phosphotransfer) domain-containing protein